MKHLLLAAVAMSAVLGGSALSGASAADLPRRSPAYVAPAYAPIFTWTGFYAGINGGYGFGDTNGYGRALAGSPGGGLIGATAGYNYQYQRFVLGLEADFDYAGITDSQTSAGPVTAKSNLNFETTIRARAGYAVDRALFFVTGGYAGGNLHSTVYDTPRNFYGANSNYLNGYAIGGGAEYAFMPNLSGKVEYIYTDLGQAYNFAHTTDVTRIGLSTSNIKAGINYHF
jgi:outer membrane immunogenic protein